MSRATQVINTKKTESEPEFVWPEYTPSTAHRHFLGRLKRARIERGLSIADMSDEVGLTFGLANEFEHGVTPLPFEWLEVWCETVGVPFADYLAIYWADEREWAERQVEQREDAQKEAEQQTPCITNTGPNQATVTKAPALLRSTSHSPRGFSLLAYLRSLVAHIRSRLRSLFSTPK